MNLTFVIAHADGRVEQAHVTADHPVTIGREATNDICEAIDFCADSTSRSTPSTRKRTTSRFS